MIGGQLPSGRQTSETLVPLRQDVIGEGLNRSSHPWRRAFSRVAVSSSHLWADRGARKSELRGVADHQNSPYVSRDRTSDVLERNRLQPTEALFDPLPFPLADLITVVPRGPRIDRASTVPLYAEFI